MEQSTTLALGPARVSVSCTDPGAGQWLLESMRPWYTGAEAGGDVWRVEVVAEAGEFAALSARRPPDAPKRPCFAFDQFVVSLPAWKEGKRTIFADWARGCFFAVEPLQVRIVADPGQRRWRIVPHWILAEIAATTLRRTFLDMHASCVEADGRAVLIAGPKEAGKTTLSLQLLGSGLCRWIGNDRTMVGAAPPAALGVPVSVRIRQTTREQFPLLFAGLPEAPRVYLYTLDELDQGGVDMAPEETDVVALSPAQFVRQLGISAVGTAPLGALVFPRISAKADGWTLERLTPAQVATAIRANVYGQTVGPRAATVFESLTGGVAPMSPDAVKVVSETVPGYRLVLGPNAYDDPGFAARLLEGLLPG